MKLLTKKSGVGFVAALAVAVLTTLSPSGVALAASCSDGVSGGIAAGINCGQNESTPNTLFGGDGSVFNTVVNTLLFVIGAVSVIMLIWGGIRYTTSAGNSNNVTAAKNTIMYAIIGLIIAFLAYAIVNWLLGAVGGA